MTNQDQGNYDLENLLKSDFLSVPTREALEKRMAKTRNTHFFNDDEYLLLSIICDLLVDQDGDNRQVEVAMFIDERLFNKVSDGWRYDKLPADDIAYKSGLEYINKTCIEKYDNRFLKLDSAKQITVLEAIQNGDVSSSIWKNIPPKLFFEDLLAETTEIFFSHPAVQQSIDYVGMADAKGWTHIKLNQSERPENA